MLQKIELANKEAVRRIFEAEPVLIDVQPAGSVIEGLRENMILHSGPPIDWARMCGPMRGAVCGIAVFEGWAENLADAEKAAAAGRFSFHPNHHYGAVGPMTGMTTISQPVVIVENRTFGNRAYCTINEGLGKVMRFGGNDSEVLGRLRWIADVLGPALSLALKAGGGIGLKSIIARGLAMGDEMHQRNVACSALFLRDIAPSLARTANDNDTLAEVLSFIGKNDQFFLNIAMAMGKSMTDPAQGIDASTIVTAMCRNGTDFGVRISGTGDQWFTAPVEMPSGLFIGAGSASEAADYTNAMYEITTSRNAEWTIPNLDFAGVPTGIDIRKVLQTGTAPVINTGIAHKQPGVGQVGAGIVRAPLACFEQGLAGLAQRMGIS